jgi:putative glutamine amidotransferase
VAALAAVGAPGLGTLPVTGPVIGIVGHGYAVPKPFGELPVTGTPQAYVAAITHVGARPVIVPPRAGLDLLDLVDGLVLTGGGDVDPARYGAPGTATEVDLERDDAEIALVRAAAEARLPVLGVCRGHQVLAVALGGTLVGGLAHLLPHDGHAVRTAPGSLVHELLGGRPHTSALHRQAVLDPGPAWRPTAWTEDGVIEAIEPTAGDWPALGVQWHPELAWVDQLSDETGPALFRWLAEAARTHHQRREHDAAHLRKKELPWKHSPLTA